MATSSTDRGTSTFDFDPGPVPAPSRPVDRFGFVRQDQSGSPDGFTQCKSTAEQQRVGRRIRKWRKMIGVGGSDWKHYVRRKPHVVKRRIRTGIPDCLRGLVWQLISGSRDLLLVNPGVYEQLVIYETSASEMDIIRDISRTFPSHIFFQQRHGPGQRSLYNVLKAYSVYDRDVGYVQGMGFVAGLLLLYMSEEDAFWLVVALLKGAVHAPMEGLYQVGLPLVQQYLFQFEHLVKDYMPQLGEHFSEEMINPSMYGSQWFITVFSYSFPFPLVLRIWDIFLNVTIAVAHGKQYSRQLEETMAKFGSGETKILISTNIVESGLDIQNANTIIIQDVHQFGLAQLYQLRGRVGRSDKEAYAYLFYSDKSLLSDHASERLAALEEYHELGQGFQLAERDMGIRGFGNIFGEQQTGDIGNVGVDLFFEMLFESLSKVEEHRLVSIPYTDVQLDLDITHHHSTEYINYLENPLELISEAEKAAEKDIWCLMLFTEALRQRYGKEPRSMELFLKKLYVKRMAADLGIRKIYSVGKVVSMQTVATKKVFKIMTESMASEIHRNCLTFDGNEVKAKLLLELPSEQLLNWIFQCLSELYASLPALVKY